MAYCDLTVGGDFLLFERVRRERRKQSRIKIFVMLAIIAIRVVVVRSCFRVLVCFGFFLFNHLKYKISILEKNVFKNGSFFSGLRGEIQFFFC